MKTKLTLILLLFTFSFYLGTSQVPQGFNYQAVARDGTGVVIADKLLPVRITIQTSLTGGIKIWEETHSVTTNQFGVMVLIVGTGTWTGGTATLFSDINWGTQPLYLKTEVQYPGSVYAEMGTTQLWSVPYSMVAKDIEGPVEKLGVAGTTDNMSEALFEVKNKTGQTVFAVYNEGVRVYVDDGAKGAKGGFAIGGFGTSKGVSQKYFYVNSDTIRMYIDDTPGKTAKGGFAIGGFGTVKGKYDNYLKVDIDKINAGKIDYLKVSGYNTFIGENAGSANPVNSPTYNTFIGYQSGFKNTGSIATYNLFIGHEAGYNSTTGTNNVFLGLRSGYQVGANAHNNVFIGKWSGYVTTGSDNIFIGNRSGLNNTSGNGNVFLGLSAGLTNSTGYGNLFLASNAGQENTTGWNNVFMGYAAGGKNQTGNNNLYIGAQAGNQNLNSNNVFMGYQSGFSNIDGKGNIFIGYKAGFNETRSNIMVIDNNYGAKPLIWGEFKLGRVVIAGDSLNNTGGFNLFVNGSSGGSLSWNSASDQRLKKNIVTIPEALDKVLHLRGVNFEWIDQSVEPGKRMGLIAQETGKVIPEIVNTKGDYLSLQYGPVSALLIEAIKEQQKQIDAQGVRLDKISEENSALKKQNDLLTEEIGLLQLMKTEIDELKSQVAYRTNK